jgi:acyl-CoA thioesterase-1
MRIFSTTATFCKRVFTGWLALAWVVAGWGTPGHPPVGWAAETRSVTIVAMGDSLTEGYGVPEEQAYPALLEKRLRAAGLACRVINTGVSGETSSGARSRLQWVLNLKPDIVILETGANDGLRGIDPNLIRSNLSAIVRELKRRDVVVVLAGMKIVTNLGREYTEAFSRIYPEVAAETNVIFIPFMLEGVAGNPKLNQPDGIHPTAEGYAVVLETIWPYVQAAIAEHRGRTQP